MNDNMALPLKSLEIDCKCTFTTTATKSLAQFITRSTTLLYLRLCIVTFTAQGLIELTEAIHHSNLQEKKLEKLKLQFEVSSEEDAANFTQMFTGHPDMLRSIDWTETLGKNTYRFTTQNPIMRSVSTFVLEHYYIDELNLSSNSISDAGAVALAQALCHNSSLKLLDLSNNSISDAGAAALAKPLYRKSPLRSLDLSNNSISDAGGAALAKALHRNTSLVNLNLSNNSISDTGAAALAKALHHNSALEKLKLSNNSIGDAGASALAKALHQNSILMVLDLYGSNAIGKYGTHQLVQALTVNVSISKCGGLTLPESCEIYALNSSDTLAYRIMFW